jgi:hypothetical protein
VLHGSRHRRAASCAGPNGYRDFIRPSRHVLMHLGGGQYAHRREIDPGAGAVKVTARAAPKVVRGAHDRRALPS